MNPIGDVKGFILDVMKNIAIVFGIGYMGGSLVALYHLDKTKIDEILPIDLNQSPYVGKKAGFSFSGYGFPYTIYTHVNPDFMSKVINWLVTTCALLFVGVRSIFRLPYSIPLKFPDTFNPKNINFLQAYDLFLFYLVPLFLIGIAMNLRAMSSVFIGLLAFYAIFAGKYLFQEEKMTNGLWYGFAPLSFFYNTFTAPMESGILNLLMKFFFSFIAFMLGCFALFFVYPLWWSSIISVAILYYIIYLFFLPLFYGFGKVIKEMGNHRLTLMILFMLMTIYSAKIFLVPLAMGGVVVGSIYMVYLLLKNKINLNMVFSAFKNNVKK